MGYFFLFSCDRIFFSNLNLKKLSKVCLFTARPAKSAGNQIVSNHESYILTLSSCHLDNATMSSCQLDHATMSSHELYILTLSSCQLDNATMSSPELYILIWSSCQLDNATISSYQVDNAAMSSHESCVHTKFVKLSVRHCNYIKS